MRWMVFALLAMVGIVLQTTIAPHLAVRGVWPDWLLVLAVFFALYVRGWDALLAAWALGALADLQSAEHFGVLSLAYLAGAGAVYLFREAVFRTHPLAQFVLTAAAGLIVQGAVWIYLESTGGLEYSSPWAALGRAGLIALYTAAWAPPIHAALLRVGPLLGLETPRRRLAGQPF